MDQDPITLAHQRLALQNQIIKALMNRVMDSRSRPDFSIVEIGFATDAEALEFHEAITALGTDI